MIQISAENHKKIQVELSRVADFGGNPDFTDDVWMGKSYCSLNFDKFCFQYRCGTAIDNTLAV